MGSVGSLVKYSLSLTNDQRWFYPYFFSLYKIQKSKKILYFCLFFIKLKSKRFYYFCLVYIKNKNPKIFLLCLNCIFKNTKIQKCFLIFFESVKFIVTMCCSFLCPKQSSTGNWYDSNRLF